LRFSFLGTKGGGVLPFFVQGRGREDWGRKKRPGAFFEDGGSLERGKMGGKKEKKGKK